MKTYSKHISKIAIGQIFKVAFLLLMSGYISMDNIIKNLDCFEANEIELTEENEAENEKEELKKELDRIHLVSDSFSQNLLTLEKLHSSGSTVWGASQFLGEIPTPPPKSLTA